VRQFTRAGGNRFARGATVRDVGFVHGSAYVTAVYPRAGRSLGTFVLSESGGGWKIASLPGSSG
jgi:hypothetical protein